MESLNSESMGWRLAKDAAHLMEKGGGAVRVFNTSTEGPWWKKESKSQCGRWAVMWDTADCAPLSAGMAPVGSGRGQRLPVGSGKWVVQSSIEILPHVGHEFVVKSQILVVRGDAPES